MKEATTVKINHPDGVSMRYSKSLIEYLANRENKSAAFYLGHWLALLEDSELEQLRVLANQFMDGVEETYLDDIVSVCIHAMSAETRKPQIKLTPSDIGDWVGSLYVNSSIDSYRRRGWVELGSTLSIKPHKRVTMTITELGFRSGETMLQRLH